ncbi:GMC oxidoreductase [Jaapia argillacea MUCL 33604]|uniref:GMC oxidoreductase n=1 Tax=Jaapia argillacea MUCL 33604 TaxID=933084 RepID=A0A067PBP4_9AGAM|nr:GMC oxidoreductase [Jaapia argillacea MUCL 33604]
MAAIEEIVDKTFDYVICGGGTAGLTLASRLSQDPSLTVLVLEAGLPNIDDPKIVLPAQFGATFGDPKFDWWFKTVPQKHSKDKEYFWSRGKGLGGSSCMNFYAWSKPPKGDVDAIEKLGNPGWNWDDYAMYTKRSETFHPPTPTQSTLYPHTFEPTNRGTSGPIQTTIPHLVHTIDELFQETMVNRGLKTVRDPYGGDITGTWIASANLDPKTWTRSYATTAYYLPYKDRPNFKVLTEAVVARVLFADAPAGVELTATGVEFIHGGKMFVVNASKEVILSAGTIKSPQILELSGIGTKSVLDKIGVKQKVELPVGENVQDHTFLGVSFELDAKTGHETYDLMRDPGYVAEQLKLHKELKGMYRLGITSFAYFPLSLANPSATPTLIASVERGITQAKRNPNLPPGLAEQWDIQLETLKDDTLPDLEIIAFPGFFTTVSRPEEGKRYVTVLMVLNHPFSRGSVHAKSNDPLDQPAIDPNYFENDFDLENLVQHVKFIKSMADTEPWKSGIVREVDPGPECTTDQQIREFIYDTHGTCWHTIGSCSMLPREKNGVVDPNLKVYGTTNLRVVDISIVPIHIAAHTHATAYVIGEKAADIILGKV